MAIASVGTLGTGAHSTSASSFTFTTATNTLAAGDYGVLTVVTDNIATADGVSNNHTTVSGGTGTWFKLGEYTNSPGGVAADGATTSVWMFAASGTVNTGTTITITLSSNATDKTCSFWKFTVAAGKLLASTNTPLTSEVTASNDFGSSAFSGLASTARLYYRGLGKEANSTTNITVSTNFSAISAARSRNNAAAMIVRGEFRINTSTGETSNPTLAVSGDTAGVFVTLEELDPKTLAVDGGSYSVSGSTVEGLRGLIFPVDAGAYALTGDASTVGRVLTVAGDAGSYALTGDAVTLTLGGGAASFSLQVDAGTYALSGDPASVVSGRLLTVDGSSYTTTGTDVGFGATFLLTVDSGVYAHTGENAQLHYAPVGPSNKTYARFTSRRRR